VPSAAPHSRLGGSVSPSTAFCFQPAAISTHPLIFTHSHHGGTQAASTSNHFHKKSCACDARAPLSPLFPLLCTLSHPLAASAASLVPTAAPTVLGTHHRGPAYPLPAHQRPLWHLLAPTSARQPAQEGELGRSSWTTAGEGDRCRCRVPLSPQPGFSPKPPAWGLGERKKVRMGHPHLYIHLQPRPLIRVQVFLGRRVLVCRHRPSLAETQKRSQDTGRCASPGRPAPVLRWSSASEVKHFQLRTSVNHGGNHPRPAQRSLVRQTRGRQRETIGCRRSPTMGSKSSRSRRAGGDAPGARSPFEPRSWNWHPLFIADRSPSRAELQPGDGRSGIKA